MGEPSSEDLNVKDGFVVLTSDLKDHFFKASDRSVFERLRTADDENDSKLIGVLYRDGEVVGLSEFDVLTSYGYQVNIKYLEVAEPFLGNEYGVQLLRETFGYARRNCPADSKALITTSGFTDDGREHIRPRIDDVAEEFPDVEFASYPTC